MRSSPGEEEDSYGDEGEGEEEEEEEEGDEDASYPRVNHQMEGKGMDMDYGDDG